MGQLENTSARYRSLLNEVGKRALSALFPNDFEFYMISLELVNSNGETVDFFTWPVMPNQLSFTSIESTNIKQTAGGVTSIDKLTFLPVDISISGNFGRKFKFLLGSEVINFSGIRFSTENGYLNKQNLMAATTKIKDVAFSTRVKTGYGCIKILEAICNKSKGIDQFGKPFSLYFYNPAFGHNFLAKSMSIKIDMADTTDNMIHKYNVQLKGIAPLEDIENFSKKSLNIAFGVDFVNKKVSKLTSTVRRSLF